MTSEDDIGIIRYCHGGITHVISYTLSCTVVQNVHGYQWLATMCTFTMVARRLPLANMLLVMAARLQLYLSLDMVTIHWVENMYVHFYIVEQSL